MTNGLKLTVEADKTHIIKWWVDASFSVHKDMKSHTGGTMSMGKGSVYATSTRPKLDTKSLTEAELVGVDDLMPMIIWTRYLLKAQGYEVHDSKIYQDNQSDIIRKEWERLKKQKDSTHQHLFFGSQTVHKQSK